VNYKRFIYVGLILGATLLGCSTARQLRAKAFLERLRPPSADQVKKWAGFPERTHLTMLTKVPDDFDFFNGDGDFGKSKWLWVYEDRKGSNFTRVVIALDSERFSASGRPSSEQIFFCLSKIEG